MAKQATPKKTETKQDKALSLDELTLAESILTEELHRIDRNKGSRSFQFSREELIDKLVKIRKAIIKVSFNIV